MIAFLIRSPLVKGHFVRHFLCERFLREGFDLVGVVFRIPRLTERMGVVLHFL
jgi:hypothetical protein